jgi:ThiF family protein
MNRIRLSGLHYDMIKAHLFPGDEKEAVAVALCGRSAHTNNHTLLVQEVILIPHESCYERTGFLVHWPTNIIIPLLEKAVRNNLAILKIHCHPGWYEQFSYIDDESDLKLFRSIHSWLDNSLPHASCIMLPDGRIFGRFINDKIEFEGVNQVLVAGSTIRNWLYSEERFVDDSLQIRNMQAFGEKTIRTLNQMRVGVIGCSGTGSPVIEQLKRFGVGELVIVDPDFIEKPNLNRILNSTINDAINQVSKVDVMKRSVEETGFNTKVISFHSHVSEYEIIKELAECDIFFGCVDGAEGRHILNLISSFYLIPFFDLGIRLEADGKGGINNIFGTVHYIQPGGSSLLSRGQYNLQQLQAESIKRTNISTYDDLAKNKYLINVNESSPAVISINMQVAAIAVNDLLGRLHEYRNIPNDDIDATRILFHEWAMFHESHNICCDFFSKMIGKGDIEPLLNNPALSYGKKAA